MKPPKVTQLKSGRVYVSFKLNNKRIRLFNGYRYGINLNPNEALIGERIEIAKLLAYEIDKKLKKGLELSSSTSEAKTIWESEKSHKQLIIEARDRKAKLSSSRQHIYMLNYTCKRLCSILKNEKLTRESIQSLLESYESNSSYNTIRAYIINLCNEASKAGLPKHVFSHIHKKPKKEKLHKPIQDVSALLREISDFNNNLFICCLLVYGCLLRPHREVRELKWSDFSSDMQYVSLSGNRNKSGRNRVVPVPTFVRNQLNKGRSNDNIFSGAETPYCNDYFKTLWGRFKKSSTTLEKDQTIYSFRHTGAISIYKKTGSLEKLKMAMGHSNIVVSQIYLRGLEVSNLSEDDMPSLFL